MKTKQISHSFAGFLCSYSTSHNSERCNHLHVDVYESNTLTKEPRFLILLLAFNLLFAGACTLPPDRTLEENFQQNADDFERVIHMLSTERGEHPTIYDLDYTSPSIDYFPTTEREVLRQRWSQYRELFSKIGIRGNAWFLGQDEPKVYFLLVKSRGLAPGGDYKGYAYSEAALSPLVESLDDTKAFKLKEGEVVYKKIKDYWYLFYLVG